MSDDLNRMHEELIATMLMEERPDTLMVKDLVCNSTAEDGSTTWSARLLIAGGPGQFHEEEVRAIVGADGQVSILP
jgi:hypothetical protein